MENEELAKQGDNNNKKAETKTAHGEICKMISTKFLQPAKQNQNQNKKKSESWFFWQKTHQPTKQEPSFFAKKTPSKLISLANARSLRMLLRV